MDTLRANLLAHVLFVCLGRLADALASGAWDAEHGHLREQETYDGALRLVISEPA